MRRLNALIAVVACAVLMSVTVTGCQLAAEEATEAIIESQTGVNVEADGDKVTIEGEDGESIEFQGGDADLPDGFPGEMPVYDGEIVTSGKISVEGDTSYTVTLTTDDPIDEVKTWYQDELASEGWTETGVSESSADGSSLVFIGATKGGMEANVTIQQESGDVTTVSAAVVIAE